MGVLPALPASSELVSGRSPGSRSGGNRTRPFLAFLSPWSPQKLPNGPDPLWQWHRPAAEPSAEPCNGEKEPGGAAEPPSSAAADSAALALRGSTRHRGAPPEAESHGGLGEREGRE